MTIAPGPLRATARHASRSLTQSRYSSTAGPSSAPPQPLHTRPSPRRLPRSTLRSLVELHHKSKTFMPDTQPETIALGFEVAFNMQHEPKFQGYTSGNTLPFLKDVLDSHRRRGVGGIETFRSLGAGVGATLGRDEKQLKTASVMRSAWTGKEGWNDHSPKTDLSEREQRVQEALYGTFSRGMDKHSKQVGLEGVEERIEAQGESIESVARAWRERNK